MNFLQPQWLFGLWLALIPLVLYLFRRKAKRVPVSTLLFFRSLAREHQESAWLRRLKRWLSLLLTLLVLWFAVLALARPYRDRVSGASQGLVVVLDRSASLMAKDGEGRSRLEQAKERLADRLRALPNQVVVSLVVYDGKVEVMQSRSTNRRELLRMLDEVEVVPMEDEPVEALRVAKRLALLDAPAQVWHVSDREFEGKEEWVEEGVKYEFLDVGLKKLVGVADKGVNVGITAFDVRPAPMARNRYEAFVEVMASSGGGEKVQAVLEVRLDGRLVQLRELEMGSGESVRLVLPMEGGRGQRLEMEVKAEGDVLVWDNLVMAELPVVKPLVLGWFSEVPDPFTELAMRSLLGEERIQVLKGGVKDWPMADKPDVYVFENWVPEDWPTNRPVLVLNPPKSSGPVKANRLQVAVAHESVRAVLPEHPLLFRVVNGRVAVTQTSELEMGGVLETLWMAGNEPVLMAGEVNGQRMVVTAFQPSQSEQLALLPSFPLLMGNAVYWCAEGLGDVGKVLVRRAGEVVQVQPGGVSWRWWDGRGFREEVEEAEAGLVLMDRVGWFVDEGGVAGSSMLLSERETVVGWGEVDAAEVEAGGRWSNGGIWWPALLWGVLGVLMLESWLFHREAVY